MTQTNKIDLSSEEQVIRFFNPKTNDSINVFKESELRKIGIKNIGLKCPTCNSKLKLSSLMGIELALNCRDFGSIILEVCCNECSSLNKLHAANGINHMSDFIDFLSKKSFRGKFVPAKDLINQKYNKLVDKMHKKGIIK